MKTILINIIVFPFVVILALVAAGKSFNGEFVRLYEDGENTSWFL